MSTNNDYTSISTKCLAIVDYFMVPYECLSYLSNFKIHRSRDLFNEAGDLAVIDPSHTLLDHRLLTWTLTYNIAVDDQVTSGDHTPESFTKWNTKSIPDNLLLSDDIVRQIDEIIQHIESHDMSQQELDNVYDSFCECVLDEMERKLDKKMVHINTGLSNKRRRVKKLWNELCVAEKCWHKSPLSKKTRLKALMREAHRVFDKNVQSAK